jgi:hypothetical protein
MTTTKFDLTQFSTERSAAMTLSKDFRANGSKNPIADAWTYVKANWAQRNEKPTKAAPKEKSVKVSIDVPKGGDTVNVDIRTLLSEGFKAADISKALTTKYGKNISYQRVKNIIKRDLKKSTK